MVPMSQLWLPILLSAVAVFVVSSLIHMVSPWHKGDFPRMANEDAVLDALRPLAIPPGDYFIPRPADRGDLRSPAFLEKVRRGPVVLMTVMPSGSMSMARNLAGWFLYVVVVATLAAHVASILPAGAPVAVDHPQVHGGRADLRRDHGCDLPVAVALILLPPSGTPIEEQ
jgi:hypothetical protein